MGFMDSMLQVGQSFKLSDKARAKSTGKKTATKKAESKSKSPAKKRASSKSKAPAKKRAGSKSKVCPVSGCAFY